MPIPQWKLELIPASFRGAGFKVDANARGSGRRSLVHEFPHRDKPYTEDLGRKARAFPVTGYVIGPDYKDQRDELIFALELEGAGQLILPTLGEFTVQAREYTVREEKRAGGIAQFEMNFVEAGEAAFDTAQNTQSNVNNAADNLQNETTSSSNSGLAGQPQGTVSVGEPVIGTPTP